MIWHRVNTPPIKKLQNSLKDVRLTPLFLCNNSLAEARKEARKTKLTTKDLILRRKKLWERHKSIEMDDEVTRQNADYILDNDELTKEVYQKPYLLIECCFTIVNKEKRTVPFFLNEVQRDFLAKIETLGRQKPYFVLKGRQQGFTSLITAIQLSFAIVRRNFAGFTLADRDDNTKAIFQDKAKVIYSRLPKRLKPTEKFNSTNELYFDRLNSSWRVASASGNIGRSRTLSFIHYSEVAFFKCKLADLQKSIAEAAVSDALCIYETTANGFNEAKALWDSGYCHNLFYEWWQTKEYVCHEYEYLNMCDKWLQDRLTALREKGLRREQLCWYAKKYKSYIDKSSIRQEYPCTPEEAFIVSGDSIFDAEKIGNKLSNFNVLSTRGSFKYEKRITPILMANGEIIGYKKEISNIRFEENENGLISIVEHPFTDTCGTKTLKKPYVIGADTAGSGVDYFTAKVIDNTNGKCVATLRKQRMDEDLFAEQLFCLGMYYNEALIGVEINYSRHPVRVLRELGYPNLYYSGNISISVESPEGVYGFLTTSVTRPIIISNLVSIMRDNIDLETDRETLFEMLTFVKHDNGHASASQGSHDDLVMASAIAHFIALNYEHNIIITDTGSSFIEKSFCLEPLSNTDFMEW